MYIYNENYSERGSRKFGTTTEIYQLTSRYGLEVFYIPVIMALGLASKNRQRYQFENRPCKGLHEDKTYYGNVSHLKSIWKRRNW